MERLVMMNGQMELSFGNARSGGFAFGAPRRQGRAHWWFQRMRQIVDRAIDRQPAALPRPEQIWFPGAHRRPDAAPAAPLPASAAKAEERQICE